MFIVHLFIVIVQKLLLSKIRWRNAKLIFKDLTEMGIASKARLINYLRDVHLLYLQPIITQYFASNKSEIWP